MFCWNSWKHFIEIAERYDCDILTSDYVTRNEANISTEEICQERIEKLQITKCNSFEEIVQYSDTGKVSKYVVATLYKKDWIDRNRLAFNDNIRMGEDLLFWLNIKEKSCCAFRTNLITYVQIVNPNSITRKKTKQREIYRYVFSRELYKFYRNKNADENLIALTRRQMLFDLSRITDKKYFKEQLELFDAHGEFQDICMNKVKVMSEDGRKLKTFLYNNLHKKWAIVLLNCVTCVINRYR